MDLSQLLINSLLGDSSVNTLSKNSGVSQDQVQQVVGLALPVLMKSMQDNASTKKGEESLAKALAEHAESEPSDIAAFLQNADLEDGNKILGHILGSKKATVEKDVAKKAGLSQNQTSNILANAAPLLLSLLGGSLGGSLLGEVLGGGQAKKSGAIGGGTGALAGMLASAILGGGLGGGSSASGGGGGGLEDLIMGSLGSMIGGALKPEEPAKKTTAKKSTAKKAPAKKASKKAEPENVLDTLIGSLFGNDGKGK